MLWHDINKSHRDNAPGGSQRQLRVGELVRHAIAEMLTRGDVHDPVIEGHLITVPEVRMTADLRLATDLRHAARRPRRRRGRRRLRAQQEIPARRDRPPHQSEIRARHPLPRRRALRRSRAHRQAAALAGGQARSREDEGDDEIDNRIASLAGSRAEPSRSPGPNSRTGARSTTCTAGSFSTSRWA